MTFTRIDYLRATNDGKGEEAHRRYYGQFISPSVISRVVAFIGRDALLASHNQHFNDIPLARWDNIAKRIGPLPVSFKSLGDYATLGGLVCIAKEAARQYVESTK